MKKTVPGTSARLGRNSGDGKVLSLRERRMTPFRFSFLD